MLIVDYNELIGKLKEEDLNFLPSGKVYEWVYRLTASLDAQTVTVENCPRESDLAKIAESLARYGFFIKGYLMEKFYEGNSWVYITSSLEDLGEKVRDYQNRHKLDLGNPPSAIVLIKRLENYAEYYEQEKEIRKLFPKANLWNNPLQDYEEYITNKSRPIYREWVANKDCYIIDNDSELLTKLRKMPIDGVMAFLDKEFEEITAETILVDLPIESESFANIASYLVTKFNNGHEVLINGARMQESFLRALSSVCWSSAMLMETKIKNILNRYRKGASGVYISSNLSQGRLVMIKEQQYAISVNGVSIEHAKSLASNILLRDKDLFKDKISINSVVPLSELFAIDKCLETETLYEVEKEIFKVIKGLAIALDYSKAITVRDIVAFNHEGKVYIGLAKFELKLICDEVNLTGMDKMRQGVEYPLEKALRIYPLRVYPDFKNYYPKYRAKFKAVDPDYPEFAWDLPKVFEDAELLHYTACGYSKFAEPRFTGTNLFNKKMGSGLGVKMYEDLYNILTKQLSIPGVYNGDYDTVPFDIFGKIKLSGGQWYLQSENFGDITHFVTKFIEAKETEFVE